MSKFTGMNSYKMLTIILLACLLLFSFHNHGSLMDGSNSLLWLLLDSILTAVLLFTFGFIFVLLGIILLSRSTDTGITPNHRTYLRAPPANLLFH